MEAQRPYNRRSRNPRFAIHKHTSGQTRSSIRHQRRTIRRMSGFAQRYKYKLRYPLTKIRRIIKSDAQTQAKCTTTEDKPLDINQFDRPNSASKIPVLAYYPIHYGAEYLDASVKSIEKFVDEIVILYSPWPSYGFDSNVQCPESEELIRSTAMKASNKVTFVRLPRRPASEGEHRSLIQRFIRPYHDLLLQFDADEIWEEKSLKKSLEEAMLMKSSVRNFGINGFVNFWKSFDYACYDPFTPIRIISLRCTENNMSVLNSTIYHFGCAQSASIMNYKYLIHGHKRELRNNWLNEVYYNWSNERENLHPVANGLWKRAIPFDKQTLPNILKNHTNFAKNVIS